MFLVGTKQIPFECDNINLKIYTNGEPNKTAVLVHIPFEKKSTLTEVLECISTKVIGIDGYPTYLYTVDGKKINCASSLKSGNEYVIVGQYATMGFKPGCYGRPRTPLVVFGHNSQHIRNLDYHGRKYDYFQRLKQRDRMPDKHDSENDDEQFQCPLVSNCVKSRSKNECSAKKTIRGDDCYNSRSRSRCNKSPTDRVMKSKNGRINKGCEFVTSCAKETERKPGAMKSPTCCRRQKSPNYQNFKGPDDFLDIILTEYENYFADSSNPSNIEYLTQEELSERIKMFNGICKEAAQKNFAYNPTDEHLANFGRNGCGGSGNFTHLHPLYGSKKTFHVLQDSGNKLNEDHMLSLKKTMMTLPMDNLTNSQSFTVATFEQENLVAVSSKLKMFNSSGSQPFFIDSDSVRVGTTSFQLHESQISSTPSYPITGNIGIGSDPANEMK